MTLPLGGESTARAHGADRIVIEVGYSPHVLRRVKKQNHSALFTVCVWRFFIIRSCYSCTLPRPPPSLRFLHPRSRITVQI